MISIRDLDFCYPNSQHQVLSQIDLELRGGEITVLLGPSGAGKTTLLRCLATLLQGPEATLHGRDGQLKNDPASVRAWRKDCAMIFQDHALIPQRDVLWHVCCGALAEYGYLRSLFWWRDPDIERAMSLLEKVGLADRACDPVQSLSGGQRQRVAIARACMQNPQLLLADEPIASLDPHAATEILRLLRDMLGGERSCLVSMHQVDHALTFADRIIGLRDGRIFHDGPPSVCNVELQRALFAPTAGAALTNNAEQELLC